MLNLDSGIPLLIITISIMLFIITIKTKKFILQAISMVIIIFLMGMVNLEISKYKVIIQTVREIKKTPDKKELYDYIKNEEFNSENINKLNNLEKLDLNDEKNKKKLYTDLSEMEVLYMTTEKTYNDIFNVTVLTLFVVMGKGFILGIPTYLKETDKRKDEKIVKRKRRR